MDPTLNALAHKLRFEAQAEAPQHQASPLEGVEVVCLPDNACSSRENEPPPTRSGGRRLMLTLFLKRARLGTG